MWCDLYIGILDTQLVLKLYIFNPIRVGFIRLRHDLARCEKFQPETSICCSEGNFATNCHEIRFQNRPVYSIISGHTKLQTYIYVAVY